MANTLMFTFLSAMVNYDNLVNLFSVLSIFAVVKYIKNSSNLKYLFLWILLISLGAITKFTILPLAFIEFVILVYVYIKDRPKIEWKSKKIQIGIFVSILFILPALFLHGGNILKYRTLTPTCDQIMSVEECMYSPLFRRSVTMENEIDIFTMDGIEEVVRQRLSPIEYFLNWIFMMAQRIYGIMGHQSLFLPSFLYSIYVLIAGIFTILLVKNWKKREMLDLYALILLLFYTFILAFVQNYKSYLITGNMGLALQGRYIFPVIFIYYILLVNSISLVRNKRVRSIVITFLIWIFIVGCIPFILLGIIRQGFGLI